MAKQLQASARMRAGAYRMNIFRAVKIRRAVFAVTPHRNRHHRIENPPVEPLSPPSARVLAPCYGQISDIYPDHLFLILHFWRDICFGKPHGYPFGSV